MLDKIILLLSLGILLAAQTCQKGLDNCALCNPISKLCLECEYEVYVPNKEGGCQKAKTCTVGKNYCNECSEDTKLCEKCEVGYFPDENGGCSYSDNCEVSFKGKCLECKKNFILSRNINICRSLDLDDFRNCETPRELDGTCGECVEGYYLSSGDRKCTKTQNCKESIFEKCILCEKGFYLDKKDGKCKAQTGNLSFCKEVVEGKKCNACENGYYFDEEGNCVNTNKCKKRGDQGNCKECSSGYHLSSFGNVCTKTENCYTGIKSEGICNRCKSGYYIDYKDGKCKSNEEDNDFKNCVVVDGDCIECSLKTYLGDDHKCSTILNCAESKDDVCLECKQNYYLGKDNQCSKVKHCIYSSLLECIECEDNYYYEKNNKKCKKWSENESFEHCIYGYDDKGCEKCKEDFYLNMTDKMCYDTSLNETFFKCTKTDKLGEICASCIQGYNYLTKSHRCTNITGCIHQETEDKCIECNSYYCLDVKTGLCHSNNIKKEKVYYKCRKTDEDGEACEECIEGFELDDDGFCVEDK